MECYGSTQMLIKIRLLYTTSDALNNWVPLLIGKEILRLLL